MDLSGLNYFTCTLGQSALWKQQQSKGTKTSFATVLELIDEQARDFPDSPALGFADFTSDGFQRQPPFVTFRTLKELSVNAAQVLLTALRQHGDDPSNVTVGLLSTSNLDFVLTWLGLMRLGHTVFLLAPQLENAAIKHLCDGSGVKTIFVSPSQEHRASQAIEGVSFKHVPGYWSTPSHADSSTELPSGSSEIAYLRHTSGTSSGLPKPIIQKHWGAVGALPRLEGNEDVATFTTTPLYHGGLADCFRAWTSGAMIWFFPEGVVPVTETNVVKAIHYARKQSPAVVRVAYFTSVPYVLQSLAGDDEGLRLLQSMGLVGVGGAALAPAVGDDLVKENVRLVSRMGSAECGFLMSSHRDYESDREWQYLRPVTDENLIAFESRDDGLFELVAKPGWPLRAKQNREDGSYATSDLFQPHSHIANAWRYHSRSDAQITLANGKKFDPAPLEGAIVAAANKQLEDIFVFGTGRDFAGALLFPASQAISNDDLLKAVWPVIDRLNQDSQSHARLLRSALIVVTKKSDEPALEKSSKGTVMRRQAEERYADLVEATYNPTQSAPSNLGVLSVEELCTIVSEKFCEVLGRDIDSSDDLFRQGVDSIACIQVRKLIEASLLPPGSAPLPLNVIYEQGTIQNLSRYIQHLRRAKTTSSSSSEDLEDSDLELMADLVKTYSDFGSATFVPTQPQVRPKTVVLTGATGGLGAHILHSMRRDTKVDKIYCLIRAQSPFAAYERVSNGLSKRGLDALPKSPSYPDFDNKVVCLPSNLFDVKLGLSDETRDEIRRSSTVFIHAAWTVNFSLRLVSFEDHIRALHHLIQFSISAESQFVFISSTASVGASSAVRIAEETSSNPSEASPLGYARSKWVAEQVCAAAYKHCSTARQDGMGYEIPEASIVRVGQLCGNAAGVWNASEAFPLMLSTAQVAGCLPDLEGESLNWLPVDEAASAVLEIVSGSEHVRSKPGARTEDTHQSSLSAVPVYHVLNPHKEPKWHDLLQYAVSGDEQANFEIVAPATWLKRLDAALKDRTVVHPSQKLMGFWQQRYSAQPTNGGQVARKSLEFSTTTTSSISNTIANVRPLDHHQVLRMWKWISNNVGVAAEE